MSNSDIAGRIFASLLLLSLAAGCAKAPPVTKTDAFFVDWLKAHGEANIVLDAKGVGIKGNATRLKASVYETKKGSDGRYTSELEFRIRLPSNAEIIEFVIGMGKSEEEAIKDSQLNFLLTTFHVVYRSFMNPADPHQKVQQVTIKGASREMLMGDIYVRGSDAKEQMDFETTRSGIRATICDQAMSPQPHWIKIVCGRAPGKAIMLSAAIDNEENASLTAALRALEWPAAGKGYMMKEFIVVK